MTSTSPLIGTEVAVLRLELLGDWSVLDFEIALALRIRRIDIASPSIVELIGSLNPLKVIADAITNYRAENTRHIEIETKASIRRDELRFGLAGQVLGMIPEETRRQQAEHLTDIVRTIVDPAFLKLEHTALDPKVKQVYLVDENDEVASR